MRVLVVGAGVVGLSSAVRLLERGHNVLVASEKRTPTLTSDRAAAAFTPYRVGGDERFTAWARCTFETFGALERSGTRETGIRTIPFHAWFHDPATVEPWWLQLVGGGELVRSVPARYAWGVRLRVPMIDMRRYMPWLERRVIELGGRFEEVRFESLAETDARDVDVVVNASGLGARELVPDPLMRPIRGQIVCAPNDIQLAEAYGDSGRPGDSTYVFPFDDRIVIGGTYEVGAEREAVDEAALASIVERARALLAETGHPEARSLAQHRLSMYSGLRPARTIGASNAAIRLEIERRPGRRPIVHDYGHAGVGVTLSWGCAEDVVSLVDSLR